MEPLNSRSSLRRAALALACAGSLLTVGACGIIPAPVREGEPPPGRGGAPEQEQGSEAPESSPSEPESRQTPDGDFRTGEVPSEEPQFDESLLGPAPSGDDFTAAVEYEINRFVNMFAMEHDPDSSVSCEEMEPTNGFEGTCDAGYADYEAEFVVTVTDEQGSVEYETGRLPVSRDALEERYRHHSGEEAVRCDMGEYKLVSSGASGISCETSAGDSADVEIAADGSGVTFTDR
ncbi:hypothetical protein [Nocardiopsis composta]|uniref:Lipoprotein n=1 Tax=Nocardiopsis composta TaxID=157465 RepID=A0A7W8QMF8_9ACTN|nr:hypothetical protein [Nocardiopsis composta]MBB5433147.1 hypothetical protein [Nocardiopsis composta]